MHISMLGECMFKMSVWMQSITPKTSENEEKKNNLKSSMKSLTKKFINYCMIAIGEVYQMILSGNFPVQSSILVIRNFYKFFTEMMNIKKIIEQTIVVNTMSELVVYFYGKQRLVAKARILSTNPQNRSFPLGRLLY